MEYIADKSRLPLSSALALDNAPHSCGHQPDLKVYTCSDLNVPKKGCMRKRSTVMKQWLSSDGKVLTQDPNL